MNRTRLLVDGKGFIHVDENDNRKGYFILCCNEKRSDISIDLYNHFSFHTHDCINICSGIICSRCDDKAKAFHRKCVTKGRFEISVVVEGQSLKLCHAISSPSKATEVLKMKTKTIRRLQCNEGYYKKRYTLLLSDCGGDVSKRCSNDLFNKETKKLYEKFLAEDTDAVPQKELVRYLCSKS